MLNIVTTKISETRILDARGQPVPGIQVTYMVGDHGPFTDTGTRDEFNNGTIRAKQESLARQVNQQAPGTL